MKAKILIFDFICYPSDLVGRVFVFVHNHSKSLVSLADPGYLDGSVQSEKVGLVCDWA